MRQKKRATEAAPIVSVLLLGFLVRVLLLLLTRLLLLALLLSGLILLLFLLARILALLILVVSHSYSPFQSRPKTRVGAIPMSVRGVRPSVGEARQHVQSCKTQGRTAAKFFARRRPVAVWGYWRTGRWSSFFPQAGRACKRCKNQLFVAVSRQGQNNCVC